MTELQRYGVEWTGPTTPICVKSDTGYWTPWHLADLEVRRLQARVADLEAKLTPPKEDLGVTLLRLFKEEERKAVFSEEYEKAILAGFPRQEALKQAQQATAIRLQEITVRTQE